MIATTSLATYLENLLILARLLLVHLLDSTNVVLEVAADVFPCLDTLSEQAGGL